MTLSILFVIAAIVLFLASLAPKLQRPWMIGLGMALFAAGFLPYFHNSINR